ncbi:nitronate monooxygenase family protein [Proteinivorax hydrogeniformans]|uniref:Probable nitronate monooxygenase n=1 Tax=Proteinivorax hydrogeniformans TaxID=1826727 RepID=A0AAU8HVJ1_9FIRM
MTLAPLNIGKLQAKLPIVQGGMGVGVSLSKLAAAVANEGGVGTISGVQIGFNEPDFDTNSEEANLRALKKEISKAKQMAPSGIIAVNLMVALSNYDDMVKAAVEGGADLIVSGAGLPSHLPELTKKRCSIAPIVSSAKAAKIICKLWESRYSYLPDAIVVEGPEAGGHLGFKMSELEKGEQKDLEELVKETLNILNAYEEKYQKKIPVIAAGGIHSGKDITRFLKIGASGVQMGTRFIGTKECDAHPAYKEELIQCKQEDIILTKSPVGMPGRAIKNQFIAEINKGRKQVKKCYNCLSKCDPSSTLFCISKALVNAVGGNTKKGLLFTGKNGYKINEIVPVRKLIQELTKEVGE